MNTITLHNARLVDDPRFFTTKKTQEEMASIRVADNHLGRRDEAYKTLFVEVTLPPFQTKLLREKGLAKGDTVMVEGELEIREFKRNKVAKGQCATGTAYEMRFPRAFLMLQVAGGQEESTTSEDETATEPGEGDQGTTEPAAEGESVFDQA